MPPRVPFGKPSAALACSGVAALAILFSSCMGGMRSGAAAPAGCPPFAAAGTGDDWAALRAAEASGAALRSPKIRSLAADARGAVWIRYKDSSLGVSRLSATTMTHWDSRNSALPVDRVDDLLAEPPGEGPPGDGTWFVTSDGLTRFDPDTNEWTHLGRRHGEITDALRLLGMDGYLTGAIVDIRGLACGPGAIWISTPGRIWRYDGMSFARLPEAFVEGLSPLRYGTVAWLDGALRVALVDRDRRAVAALASWRPGDAGWKEYPLAGTGLPPPPGVAFIACGGEVLVLAPEWKGRALVMDEAAGRLVRRDPQAEPAPGGVP